MHWPVEFWERPGFRGAFVCAPGTGTALEVEVIIFLYLIISHASGCKKRKCALRSLSRPPKTIVEQVMAL